MNLAIYFIFWITQLHRSKMRRNKSHSFNVFECLLGAKQEFCGYNKVSAFIKMEDAK